MRKRVFIIHGWGNHPDEGWLEWMRTELVVRGSIVHAPPMPDPDEPVPQLWIPFLAEQVGHCDEQTFFVGHSLGAPTILRYLQQQLLPVRVGGAVFVAGFEHLSAKGAEPEPRRVLGPWLEDPIHWEAIRGRSKHFVAIFSDNDPWVPLSNANAFATKLEANTMILHDRSHFSPSDTPTIPEALDALLEMMNDAGADASTAL